MCRSRANCNSPAALIPHADMAIGVQMGKQAGIKGGMMRSQLVTSALKHIPNRYLLTRITARAIRGFHRPNTRIAETANEVLLRSGTKIQ